MKILIAELPGRKYLASKSSSEQRVPLLHLLKQSDYVSIHCALTKQTEHLINAKRLAQMKPTAYLLNLARGPIVDEAAVFQVLRKNQLAGYASDVTQVEPIPKTHPFLKKSMKHKVILTPHVAWASRESRQRLVEELAQNIAAFLKGKKRNRVE